MPGALPSAPLLSAAGAGASWRRQRAGVFFVQPRRNQGRGNRNSIGIRPDLLLLLMLLVVMAPASIGVPLLMMLLLLSRA